MKSIILPFLLLIVYSAGLSAQDLQKKRNTDTEILSADQLVKNLDGAYSVVSIDQDGKTLQFNVKIKEGKISSIAIDGEELPRSQWKENEPLILKNLGYLNDDKPKSYKYEDVYELETEIRKDLKKLEKTIQDLEVSKRLDRFYDEELRDWMESLEKEMNQSEFIQDMEDVLNDLSKELDRFLEERKSYHSGKTAENKGKK